MGSLPTPPTESPISLAILGGGIAGLTLAAGLTHNPTATTTTTTTHPRNHNLKITVYESRPAFTEIGAGVGLGPNAQRAMGMLHPKILEAYRSCETREELSREERERFFNFRWGMDGAPANHTANQKQEGLQNGDVGEERVGKDGREGGKVGKAGKMGGKVWQAGNLIADVRYNGEGSVVHRARFLGKLVELVPEESRVCGKRCVGIEIVEGERGVLVRFADGTESRHDAVIGCDGVRSVVRKKVLGEKDPACEPVFSGKCCYRGLVDVERAKGVLGEDMVMESQMYLGKGGHVLTTPIEQGRAVNVVAYHTKEDGKWEDEAWIKPATREEMIQRFKGFSQPVRGLISLIEKPDIWALFDHPHAKTYYQGGKLCLLGDSAHASTPHHGAAAGMAVEDALVLSKLLVPVESAEELECAFAAYDAVRRPRTQKLVNSSRKVSMFYDFEDEAIGDNVEATGDYLRQAWDWIWNEDLGDELDHADRIFRSLQGGIMKGHALASGAN